ncbi:MAG: DUF4115 domain-containing protein [Nitrospirae bacterium]|nr:DUF4115 domain-containing protein [Nitrospirota bacterium]
MNKEFKDKRETLGLSIAEVSKLTRIKTSYLASIEAADFDKLPVEVYSKGYIREYAKFLDIPADTVISKYDDYLEIKRGGKKKEIEPKSDLKNTAPPVPKQDQNKETYHTTGIPVYTSKQPKNTAYRSILIVPFLFSVVISYFYLFDEKEPEMPLNKNQTTAVQAPVIAQQQEAPASSEQNSANVNSAPAVVTQTSNPIQKAQTLTDNNTKKDKPAAATQKKHTIEITATNDVWILVIRDGAEKDSMMMKPGEKQSYSADKSFFLKIGNAAGVKLIYNGKALDNLGSSGQVVSLILPQPANQGGSSTSSAATIPVN